MTVRAQYTQLLKARFSSELYLSRKSKKLTQAQMAQLLCMDERSYIKLEHGQSCCSGLTLLLFLLTSGDSAKFLENTEILFESEFE